MVKLTIFSFQTLGAVQSGESAPWTWLESTDPFRNDTWCIGQPDGDSTDDYRYAHLFRNKTCLNDLAARVAQPFICQSDI